MRRSLILPLPSVSRPSHHWIGIEYNRHKGLRTVPCGANGSQFEPELGAFFVAINPPVGFLFAVDKLLDDFTDFLRIGDTELGKKVVELRDGGFLPCTIGVARIPSAMVIIDQADPQKSVSSAMVAAVTMTPLTFWFARCENRLG